MRLALCVTLLAAAPRFARADACRDLVDAAYEAARAGRWEEVPEYVKRADKIAPNADQPVSSHTLARLWYLEGVAYWFGGQKDKALDPWRITFQTEIDYPWESEAFVDDDGEALFESLRRETRSRPSVSLDIPSNTGAARFYVSGHPVDTASRVVEGRHLVQAVCPDGSVQGKWWKYGKPPKYESFCPGGFGTAVAASPAASQGEVLFDDFGNPIVAASAVRPDMQPAAGTKPAPAATKAPTPEKKPAATSTAAASTPSKQTPPKAEKPAKDSKKPASTAPAVASASGTSGGSNLASTLLLGGGGVFLAGGAAANFLLVNPTWSEIQTARDKPGSITREEADALTGRFNTWRTVTVGLLGAGVAGLGAGVLLHDAHVLVVPGGFLAQGRF
ncbi:MAG: hypothetical protein JXB39_12445 [Deltaproteobacteria bacterium]|nr:hypothetical protein [Deltaproteobacteria bacterium]